MRRLVAVVCLSVAILFPSSTQAFTLYTPAFSNNYMVCSIVNVGNLVLQVAITGYGDSGDPYSFPPADLYPGQRTQAVFAFGEKNRCGIHVQAKNPRRTATRGMVRAAVLFDDGSGRSFSFEAR